MRGKDRGVLRQLLLKKDQAEEEAREASEEGLVKYDQSLPSEKRSRDDIQTKIAADLKLLGDVKKLGQFELLSRQIAVLPR